MAKVVSRPGNRTEHFDDPRIGRFQIGIQNATTGPNACPLVDGVLVRNIVLTSGVTTNVPHKLGRPWRGYIITSRSAQATVALGTQADTSTYLSVTPSANVTVGLWIF